MLSRVICGFQDGADLGGIKAAVAAGIATGGTMPSDFKTESAYRPEYADLYNAVAHESPDWAPRTRLNVRDSQATLIFRSERAASHRGCDLTLKACGELKRPALVIPVWSVPDRVPGVAHVAELIRRNKFTVVNIAGTRGSADPPIAGVAGSGIEAFAFAYCLTLFEILKESP